MTDMKVKSPERVRDGMLLGVGGLGMRDSKEAQRKGESHLSDEI